MNSSRLNIQTSYPIECGLGIGQFHMTEIFGAKLTGRKVAIVTDREVQGYYGTAFSMQFESIGITPSQIIVDGSQISKTLDAVKVVYEGLTDAGFGKSDLLFALGGGGVMDIAGFAAATYLEGIPFVRVPTSLISMIDSGVAPYAYLNFQSHKDRIAVPSHPIHTIIDTTYLNTLPPKYRAGGLARVIQLGLTSNTELISMLMADRLDMDGLITRSIETMFSSDGKYRSCESFGEEIASSIEGHFRFLKYTHGEALALGMTAMYPDKFLDTLYQRFGLPLKVEGVTKDTLLKRIVRDFSVTGDPLSFMAISEPGNARIHTLPMPDAVACFEQYLSSIC